MTYHAKKLLRLIEEERNQTARRHSLPRLERGVTVRMLAGAYLGKKDSTKGRAYLSKLKIFGHGAQRDVGDGKGVKQPELEFLIIHMQLCGILKTVVFDGVRMKGPPPSYLKV